MLIYQEAIIAQRDRDEGVCNLMETIEDIHSFMLKADPVKTIPTHRKILEDLACLTVDSACLIRAYTMEEKFCERRSVIVYTTRKLMLLFRETFHQAEQAYSRCEACRICRTY